MIRFVLLAAVLFTFMMPEASAQCGLLNRLKSRLHKTSSCSGVSTVQTSDCSATTTTSCATTTTSCASSGTTSVSTEAYYVATSQEVYTVQGQDTSTKQFAQTMNASGSMYHDPNYHGAEVVYRSSGLATEAQARAAWQRSRGHRRLINAGLISHVSCVGNVCVGR
jgi:hypothetical protein